MRLLVVIGAGVVACAFAASCRAPTEVAIVMSTDLPCDKVRGTTVTVAPFADLESKTTPTATSTFCDPATGDLGMLVVVPSGARNDEVAFRIVAGVGQDATACVPPAYGSGCIVARRALRYLPHTPVHVTVPLRAACAGIPCKPDETCVVGACVSAVLNPDTCVNSPDGCGEGSLAGVDGGAPGDAGVPLGPLADGAADVTIDAPPFDAGPSTFTANFTALSNWSSFDMKAAGHSLITQMRGAIFDGRYVYVPPWNIGDYLRFDTTGAVSDANAWQLGSNPSLDDGFAGGVFDGRYVYFVPDGSAPGSVVARYDTALPFSSSSFTSIATATLGRNGFLGAAFDGRYIYLPSSSDAFVARYDTTLPFATASSWTSYNAGAALATGSRGAVFDGRYVYFVPAAANATPLRYDTTTAFGPAGTWTTAPVQGTFYGAAFDGRYMYYASVAGASAAFARYDTLTPFDAPGSWLKSTGGVPSANLDFRGAVFDGRYVYFVPSGTSGVLLIARYDAAGAFDQTSSWQTFDATALAGAAAGTDNYIGGAFDGRYVYLIPTSGTTVLRFDAKSPPSTAAGYHGSFL